MIVFWRCSYIIWQSLRSLEFVVTCNRQDSCIRIICLRAANSTLDSSAHWWKEGGPRHTFHLPCDECTITLEHVALQLGDQGRQRTIRPNIHPSVNRAILMPDKSQNLVYIRWLLHLVDFKEYVKLSWGSAVLVTLYQELCRTIKLDTMSIDGCLLLLQSWV
ncbi:hypothetical protein Gotur_009332, partial [Gossypium turneri]